MIREVLGIAALILAAGGIGYAQMVVSAKAGLVHHVEGDVLVDGTAVEPPSMGKSGAFPEVKANSVLRTTEFGRAELLLAPGVFLRVAEDSAIRMVSTSLDDTRIELQAGSVLIEAAELLKDNRVTVLLPAATVIPKKNGLYRLDADPGELRVYDGAAEVISGDRTRVAKKGTRISLDGQMMASKFDTDVGDPLHRWSARRAGYLAMANISAARSIRDAGYRWTTSRWLWNPYFGMFTFIPVRGGVYSPFGFAYYCPSNVMSVYRPQATASASSLDSSGGFRGPRYDPNLGYSVASQRSYEGYSSAPSSSAPAASSAPPASESPRSAESAAPRGGEGGGRSQ